MLKSYLAKKIIVTLLLTDVMTGVYTEDTLKFLAKSQIIDLFLKMQEHTNSTISKLTDEIGNLNANFKRLESDVEVGKKVNYALGKQVASLERQCWRNAQYSRRECAEMIISIPHSIVHSDLEKIVCKVLQHTGDDICGEKIESCECLNQKSHRAIVRFSKWKDCEQVMRVKKDLKDLNF